MVKSVNGRIILKCTLVKEDASVNWIQLVQRGAQDQSLMISIMIMSDDHDDDRY
jgi:hypothetical protein